MSDECVQVHVGGRASEWTGGEEGVKGGRNGGVNCKSGADVVGKGSEFAGGREGLKGGRNGAGNCTVDVTLLVVRVEGGRDGAGKDCILEGSWRGLS